MSLRKDLKGSKRRSWILVGFYGALRVKKIDRRVCNIGALAD